MDVSPFGFSLGKPPFTFEATLKHSNYVVTTSSFLLRPNRIKWLNDYNQVRFHCVESIKAIL